MSAIRVANDEPPGDAGWTCAAITSMCPQGDRGVPDGDVGARRQHHVDGIRVRMTSSSNHQRCPPVSKTMVDVTAALEEGPKEGGLWPPRGRRNVLIHPSRSPIPQKEADHVDGVGLDGGQ
jgi:hypothetical protein